MDKTNQEQKNRFNSLPTSKQLEIVDRYVNKYHGGSKECLIDWALKLGLVGQLVSNSNYVL